LHKTFKTGYYKQK